jgi:1-phosphofructokinase
MIYTLTLNPSLDYHVWVRRLTAGTIHEVEKEWKDPGGKGINVSKVLKILGMESTALGFIGGFTGAFIRQQIELQGIAHRFIQLEQDSRINIKVKAETETDLSGRSPEITKAALNELFNQLDLLTAGDVLVLAGSVPDSLPEDIYQTIMNRLDHKGIRMILDAKGKALLHSLSVNPFLIKPNHHELGDLFGVAVASPVQAVEYAAKAVEMGAENVIVSLAGEGAVMVNKERAYIARIPQMKVVNSIGAGDSMVAGFLYAYTQERSNTEAFRFAVAAGSATAISEGFCTHETINRILPHIIIQEL